MEPKANQGMQTTKTPGPVPPESAKQVLSTEGSVPSVKTPVTTVAAPSSVSAPATQASMDEVTHARRLLAGDSCCLAKLKPGEPFFVLRGQDALAPIFVRGWAEMARQNGLSAEKFAEAMKRADAMAAYTPRKLPD